MFLKHFYSGAVLSAVGALGFNSHYNDQSCTSATFSALGLPDIEIISLNVTVSLNESVAGQNAPGDANIIFAPTGNGPSNVDLCRITVKYTHPGQNDTINTYIGLPLDPTNWNSRFVMNGGGVWVAGTPDVVLEPVSNGFASTSTDGGHDNSLQVSEWGLTSPGHANIVALKDFASVALEEAAKLGKSATLLYYGTRPEYSYWNGCSTGGRQGHMAAQRFPEEFDGIIAGCPAINWDKFPLYEFWPVLMSNILDVRPPACVLQAFTSSAIAACDDLDGVKDGSISLPGQCRFDAMSMVGQTVNCTAPEGTIQITEKMSELVNFIWDGASSVDGQFEWYVNNCSVTPFTVADTWITTFLAQNSSYDLKNMSHAEFDSFFQQSVNQYRSIIGTDDYNLGKLRASGTKMITWHGMQDQLIPPNGTIDYYDKVQKNSHNGNVTDYYRLFLAPGVGHCGLLSTGLDPSNTIFSAIRAWVENGTAPNTIQGTGLAIAPSNTDEIRSIQLCPYPSILTFTGANPNEASSFSCV
ncbi:hypothetical protein PFICI_10809 [Pestalotiopsis fici W106-1]|uniref:Carboxylic ester hydrolase n=1 Tax=Pestalotiopsis fici (strain W106-1 / CGMCC3.15140) TaxID=1229662 RepID=W3WSU8_PESFW|nr:uncharacterized protein PFICI_10809 [Pestalotiopsis fici W106-1]ETS76935.1 hypothetical protein PFICI_10809 [Pestalotiopsis fici W106-1]